MRITGFLFACLLSFCCSAQDMTAVFGNMPDDMILLVDSIQRQDLMSLHREGKTATIQGKLGETTTLTSFDADFLALESGNTTTQIALLSLVNKSKVICLIQTVCAPVCDSRLSFYTHEWEPLEVSDFISPEDFSWFIKDDVDKNSPAFTDAVRVLDMDLMQFSFDPETLSLTQTYTTPQYLSKEDKEAIAPFLKEEPKVFKWEKMGFN